MADTLYQLTVRKGPKVGETFLLETFSLTVGRDPVSDVVLNDPEVSRQHARFTRLDSGGYQVQDLGSTNGTFVNGQRLEAEPADLQPGYTVSMGSGVTLVYTPVLTGSALDATVIDQSGMAGVTQHESDLAGADDEWEAAVPALPHFDEEPEIPSDWEPDPSPPFTPPPPPPVYTPAPPPERPLAAAPPFVPTPDNSEAAGKKRRTTIIAVVTALILLCCCAFLLYMWFIGGDLLLESLGLV